MPKLNIYGLGSAGVNVDKSALQLDDNELTKAQNAVPTIGSKGGIKKRPPFVKFDTDVAAGSILGFLGAPLGPGPGAGTDDETVYYVATSAGSWFKSSNSYGTSTTVTTLATPAATPVRSVTIDGRLYYASGTTIRVFDGIKDDVFSTLGGGYTIRNLSRDGLDLYVAVSAGGNGYVLQLDSAGRIRQIGAALPASFLPWAVTVSQGDLFATAFKGGSFSRIYRVRLNVATALTVWTLDYTSAIVLVDGLSDFNDLTTHTNGWAIVTGGLSGGGGGGAVYARNPATGLWAVSGGSFHVNGVGLSFITWLGGTYVATYKGNNLGTLNTVFKIDSGGVWNLVFTDATASPPRAMQFYAVGTKLFLVQAGRSYVHYTTDGVTWTASAATASAVGSAFGSFLTAGGIGPAAGATSSFIVLQGGASLQLLNQAGTLTTLTLPSDITLASDRPPRFAIYDRFLIVVNTPSRPITVDAAGKVRALGLLPPVLAVTGSSGGAGNLSGLYKVRQTFLTRSEFGEILSESDMGPEMEVAVTLAGNSLLVSGLNLSASGDVTDSRLYRTTTGGSVYFPWLIVNGNGLVTAVADDLTDAGLGTVAVAPLGTPPRLALVASWRGRVWGVDRADVDYARYSETGVLYAWPLVNSLLIGRKGADSRGITAFIPRRDALGIGRREGLYQVTGTTASNFNVVTLSEHCGVESQETVKVFRDVAYFLWKDGVYRWGPSGIDCLSDGKVRNWFISDLYFNRARFPFAFAGIDPIQNKYRLFLAALGSSVEDRYVEYDLTDGTWWGPHKCGAFTAFASAGGTADSADRYVPLVGSSDGYLWKPGTTAGTDDTATAIALDVDLKRHDGLTPDIEKVWLQPSFLSKVQAAGSLTITPYVGSLTASAGTAVTADLTKGREKLPRLGVGKHCGFNLAHSTVAQDVEIYGYEIPFFELGRR